MVCSGVHVEVRGQAFGGQFFLVFEAKSVVISEAALCAGLPCVSFKPILSAFHFTVGALGLGLQRPATTPGFF